MNQRHLITMANQIAVFFETMPDRRQALNDFALHIKRSWEPRMRRELLEYVEKEGGTDLNETAREGIRLHADVIR
ncbi:formate dehydrogenase subunit delta [Glaciimonas soli]|uniref:Formate dehydrogenase n=1 Tax=Glaciimonas soli TaxID=2590999 RepID=A0A843YS95_9BURK|nr:formate dehydrogenase subunit delta [Glaciimonas soli]MQR00122.1 formate dehydrogenase [Glaciimonas soli]